jgi:acetone carboxylase gamma subunit
MREDLARQYSRAMEHDKWVKTIPVLQFKTEWSVKVIPPTAGAVVRFLVKANDKQISVYLDCYDHLGFVGQPYWEAYPIGGDARRFYIGQTEELMQAITEELESEGGASGE